MWIQEKLSFYGAGMGIVVCNSQKTQWYSERDLDGCSLASSAVHMQRWKWNADG